MLIPINTEEEPQSMYCSYDPNYLIISIELTFFRLHGSYEALKYGTLLDGLSDLTGGITESIAIRQDPTACGRALGKLLDMTSLITCTVNNNQQQQQIRTSTEKLANGIQMGINYRLYAIERVIFRLSLNNEVSSAINLNCWGGII